MSVSACGRLLSVFVVMIMVLRAARNGSGMSGHRVVPQVSWVSWCISDVFLPGRGLVVVLHCRQQSGRSPYV